MELEDYRAAIRRLAHLPVPLKLQAYQRVPEVQMAGPLAPHEQSVRQEIMERMQGLRAAGLPWFHGGTAGRAAGDTLLPPRVTGANPRGQGNWYRASRNHVYVTFNVKDAINYVVLNERLGVASNLYVVAPEGEIDVDREGLRLGILAALDPYTGRAAVGLGLMAFSFFTCESAKVLAVHEVPAPAKARGAMAHGCPQAVALSGQP